MKDRVDRRTACSTTVTLANRSFAKMREAEETLSKDQYGVSLNRSHERWPPRGSDFCFHCRCHLECLMNIIVGGKTLAQASALFY